MRFALFHILGLAATAMAIPDGFEPAGDALHPLIPKTGKRSTSIVKGTELRDSAEEGDDSPTKRPRFLRKARVVPDSLQNPASKRAPSCSGSGSRVCPDGTYCCPRAYYYCALLDGTDVCCPNGEACNATTGECVDSSYVKCSNYDFCCKPGYTCYLDSAGERHCRVGGSKDNTKRDV